MGGQARVQAAGWCIRAAKAAVALGVARAIGIAAIGAIAVGCSQPAPTDEAAPSEGSKLGPEVDSFFVALEPDSLRIPRGPGAAGLCAEDPKLMDLYPGPGIQAVTQSVPFSPTRGKARCDVTIRFGDQQSNSYLKQWKYRHCGLGVTHTGAAEIYPIASASYEERFPLSECFYRLAMRLEGYQAALSSNAFDEYPNSAFFVGKRDYVGQTVTNAAAIIAFKCPNALSKYYTDELAAYVAHSCK